MYIGLSVACILVAVCVTIQDFGHREIYWWLSPLMLALLAIRSYTAVFDHQFMVYNWIMNVALLSVQLGLAWLYFSIRKRSVKNMLGLGDVLFLYALAFGFPVYVFTIGLCVAYLLALIGKLLLPGKQTTIPLAGWLAIVLIAELAFELIQQRSFWDYMYSL